MLPGCDPPPARDILLGPESKAAFDAPSLNTVDGTLPTGADLVIRFPRRLDAGSVGPRSVVLETADAESPHRRRVTAAAATIDGDAVRFPAALVASVAGDHALRVRVEGGASPCAVRAADGEALARRFVATLRIAQAVRADLEGPSLVASRPADGAGDVAPGATVELRFSEPVASGAALGGDAVTLRVDGVAVPARLRLSADRRRMIVRPETALPPGAAVEVEIHRCLVDDAGNPAAADSPRTVRFGVRATALREIEESFSCDDYLDRSRTDCSWGGVEAPGLLVPRCGAVPLPALDVEPTTDLGDRDEIRFQVIVRADEVPNGLASGLRLRFAQTTSAGPLRAAVVEGGPVLDSTLEPWFQGNRERAQLRVLATRGDALPWEPDGAQGAVVDVPFEQPLALVAGQAVLLDVVVAVEPGARLAAAPDAEARTLLRGAPRERLAPSAALLVSGASPAARSLWYDAGTDAPRWRGAVIETGGPVADADDAATHATPADGDVARVVAEFQSAPADAVGAPDATSASDWERDLSRVPSWRFVRFRLRFEGAVWDGRAAPVDRVLMPFEAPATAR